MTEWQARGGRGPRRVAIGTAIVFALGLPFAMVPPSTSAADAHVRWNAGIDINGSAGDYSWGGAYGTFFWVDPKENLAVVFMAHTPGVIRQYYRALLGAMVMQAIEK